MKQGGYDIWRKYMKKMNDKNIVNNQYKDTSKLDIRIMIHKKYSSNKMGFAKWIYSNYKFEPNMHCLELGCGTGEMWKDNLGILNGSKIILTDFSEAMVNKTKEIFKESKNISYNIVNIEKIPYGENEFDVEIANMMLYHVSNIPKALSEVSRVLKNRGTFYCATFGENTILNSVCTLLEVDPPKNDWIFTLQNGYEILKPFFTDVKRLDYVDSLEITDLDDLLDYLDSLNDLHETLNIDRNTLKKKLQEKMMNGILSIPKEYGMFICKK